MSVRAGRAPAAAAAATAAAAARRTGGVADGGGGGGIAMGMGMGDDGIVGAKGGGGGRRSTSSSRSSSSSSSSTTVACALVCLACVVACVVWFDVGFIWSEAGRFGSAGGGGGGGSGSSVSDAGRRAAYGIGGGDAGLLDASAAALPGWRVTTTTAATTDYGSDSGDGGGSSFFSAESDDVASLTALTESAGSMPNVFSAADGDSGGLSGGGGRRAQQHQQQQQQQQQLTPADKLPWHTEPLLADREYFYSWHMELWSLPSVERPPVPAEVKETLARRSVFVPSKRPGGTGTQEIVALFTNMRFAELLMNVVMCLEGVGVHHWVIFCFDQQSYAYFHDTMGLPALLMAYTPTKQFEDLNVRDTIFAGRTVILREVLSLGYSVLCVDSDMVWRQNVLDYVDRDAYDVHAMSGINPFTPWKMWGTTLNAGLVYLKSNARVLHMMETWLFKLQREPERGDQYFLNYSLLEYGLHMRRVPHCITREGASQCYAGFTRATYHGVPLQVFVFDSSHFITNCEESGYKEKRKKNPILVHASCGAKAPDAKKKVFENIGFWYLRDNWRQLIDAAHPYKFLKRASKKFVVSELPVRKS